MEENKKKQTLDFASLGEMIATTSSKSNSKYSKEDLETYVSNLDRYSNKFREISDFFYVSNGLYKNIVNSFTNLATLDNVILPSSKTIERSEDKSYGTYFDKVNNYADSVNIKMTTRSILKNVAKYGAYIGYERSDASEFYFQPLPLDFCRIKYRIGNEYQLEFNFKYFDKFFNKEDLDFAWLMYPKEFKGLYNKYKKDTKSRNPEWQILDIKRTVCILAEEDEPNFIPMFSGMFESILANEEVKDLIQLGQKLDISKLVIQTVPTDKDGNITMPKEMVQFFHEQLKKILPEGANGLTTALNIESVPFANQNQTKQDLLAKSERGVFISSGFSSSMFADNGGHTGLQMNVEVVTANIFATLEKIENAFNRKFKNVANTKTYEFKLKFFRTTNVNIGDNFERAYKLLAIGGAITPLYSLLGFDAETYSTLLQVENQLKVKDLLIVPQSMHTQNADGSSDSKVGNPEKDEKDLSDEGAKARDTETKDK